MQNHLKPSDLEVTTALGDHTSHDRTSPYTGGCRPRTADPTRAIAARLRSSTTVSPMTVDDLIAIFVAGACYQRITSSTRRRYKRALQLLADALGAKRIVNVTATDAESFHNRIAATAQSSGNGGVARAREAVEIAGRVWSFGQSYGYCTTNPFRAIRFERRVSAPATWRSDQLARFIAAADASNRPEVGTAAALAYWLFLRTHDVLAIRRDHFDGTSLWVPDRRFGKMRMRLDSNPDLLIRVQALFGSSAGTSSGDTPWGQPQAFRRAFAHIRRRAGLPANLTLRGLRPSGLLALFEAGVMPAWLASQPQFRWTGQSIGSRRHTTRTRDWQINRAVRRIMRRRSEK